MFLLDVVPDRPTLIPPSVEPGTVATIIGITIALMLLIIVFKKK